MDDHPNFTPQKHAWHLIFVFDMPEGRVKGHLYLLRRRM
jgi:hypothetical protein